MASTRRHLALIVLLTVFSSSLPNSSWAKGSVPDDKKSEVSGTVIPKDGKGSGAGDVGQQNSNTDKSNTVSHIQVVFPPSDMFTSGDCRTRSTLVGIRATTANQKGLMLASGELTDKDTHQQLPAMAFDLSSGTGPCPTASTEDDIPVDKILSLQLVLKESWIRAGNYSGVLRIAGKQDTGAQDLKFNVSIRPLWAWWVGIFMIALGAVISWFAVTYAVRQRQIAGNEILISRLTELLRSLRARLDSVKDAGAPPPNRTLVHIDQIMRERLPQLSTDKELSVIAGVTVPASGTVTVLDEVEGVNRIVRNGFEPLLDRWNQQGADRNALTDCFGRMDALGGETHPLSDVDQGIAGILATAPPLAVPHGLEAEPAEPPTESAVVHRVIFTTHLLDLLSFLTIVLLGVYFLIWKNPGFGSIGSLLEAFLWGLGLKLGTDASRLGQSDVRSAFGIKIPAP